MHRPDLLSRLTQSATMLDMVVIGGGVTGESIALDATARGTEVGLLEQSGFGRGASSRSTKLVHGGVRYLAQGNVSLVRAALHERTLLRRNAPHVVRDLSFAVPCRGWLDRWWYGLGFAVYDLLSGKSGFRKVRSISQSECLSLVPTLRSEVVWAVRPEMARTVEDVLARRSRLLFLTAAAAVLVAPQVASLVARELGRDQQWEERQVLEFKQVASFFQC